MTTIPAEAKPAPAVNWVAGLWRWHFYASFIVIPIFAMLAVTGLMWLYRYEIQTALHPGVVAGFDHARPQPLDDQVAAVMAAYPDAHVLSVMEPWADRATMVVVQDGDVQRQVYVDPGTARVTGALEADHEIYDIAIQLHGDLTAGRWGDGLIELAACWAIVMALTGYYLFFSRPRAWSRSSNVANAGRVGAQNLRFSHGVLGLFIGVGILFQVVSGLPWTGLWGERVQQFAAGRGLSLWGEDPGAESTLGDRLEASSGESAPAPWALGESAVPSSGHAGHPPSGGGLAAIGLSLDALAAKAEGDRLPRPYLILMPEGETGVFSVLADQWMVKGNPAFRDVTQERVLHFDRYSGEIIGRYGYADYSPVAKLVSQGIAIHEGRRFGLVTTVTATLFCLGILAMCVTGPLMWWSRRRAGRGLDAPRGSLPLASPWLLGVVVALGVALPLFGLSLAAVLLLDRLLIRRVPSLRRFFNTAAPATPRETAP